MRHKLTRMPYRAPGGAAKKNPHTVLFFWSSDPEQIVQIKDRRLLRAADCLAAVASVGFRHKLHVWM